MIAANILGCDPHYIRLTAREAPEELGYNVTRIGRNTKIPRIGFIRFWEGVLGMRTAYEIVRRIAETAMSRPRVGRRGSCQAAAGISEKSNGQALAGRACQAGPGAVF